MSNKNNRYKILTWNINQATNKKGNNKIPELVNKEIIRQNPDILVLTEFAFCEGINGFIEDTLLKRGYSCFPKESTDNTKNKQNEILIAWRTELFECMNERSTSEAVTKTNNKPNFAKVMLVDREYNKKFVVAGIRITMAEYIPKGLSSIEERIAYQKQAIKRRKQMEYVYDILRDYETVIAMGDFNNYRRGTHIKNWNISEIICNHDEYIRYTPEGQSIKREKEPNVEKQFAEDHFLAKGCEVKDFIYDRSFIMWDNQIYNHGADFSDWNRLIGYPDHAILYGDLYL